MVRHDNATFLKMTNSERLFLNENKPTLEISSTENLLKMRNTEQLLYESDKSTARYQTLLKIREGEHSYIDLINDVTTYEYLPLIKVKDFAGSVMDTSSNIAMKRLKDRGIYTTDKELGKLTKNEKSKLIYALRGVMND